MDDHALIKMTNKRMNVLSQRFCRRIIVLISGALLASGNLSAEKAPGSESQPDVIMTEERLRRDQEADGTNFDRGAYGRVVHLYGDSISRGIGFMDFEDPSPLSRIQGIADLLLRENGVPSTDLVVRYAWSQDPRRVKSEIRAGLVRPGDVVVYQDAGPHENVIDERRARLQNFINAVPLTDPRIELILTTTFDYDPPPSYENSRYDEPVAGSNLSMNALLLKTAASENVSVLDWNSQMDAEVSGMAPFGVSLMREEGVHPNALGNFALAISLLQRLGIEIKSWESVANEFAQINDERVRKLSLVPPLKRSDIDRILASIAKLVKEPENSKSNGQPRE
ncbi:MAG: SGNH/GDSL hydrolase family protein [Terrimicrobiaceae bacterium]